jgi:hypothetical protein
MRQTKTGDRLRRLGASLATAACLPAASGMGQSPPPPPPPAGGGPAQTMTLDDCLRAAMEGNHRRRASKFAVVMAEAQHYKTRYDHLALQSSMVLVVGSEVLNQLKLNQ